MSYQQTAPRGTTEVDGTPIDVDGDRETDALLSGPFDANGNGVADAVLADVDFDGQADGAILDIDEDGEVESVATVADLDGDGIEDSVAVDVGMDGTSEAIVSDFAGDGSPDLIIADADLDGELDTAVVDSDNDGVFDELISADGSTVSPDLDGTQDFGGTTGIDDDSIVAYGPDDSDFATVPADIGAVEDTTGTYAFDGGVADYSSTNTYGSYDSGTSGSTSMIQDYSDDTSLEDPITATDAWDGGLRDTYQSNTDASNAAYEESTAAWLAGDTSAAYDLNQQSLEYGATADQAWDTYSTWDSSSSDVGGES